MMDQNSNQLLHLIVSPGPMHKVVLDSFDSPDSLKWRYYRHNIRRNLHPMP